jgi:hypothetical protein
MCQVAAGETYGYMVETWENAKSQAVRAIVRQGRKGSTISYSDLAKQITTIYFDAHEHIYHLMLGQISSEEDAAGRGMLTALVVLKDSGMPGDGFWDLAKRLGRNVSDKIACWVQETEFVLSHCKNHPLVVQQP